MLVWRLQYFGSSALFLQIQQISPVKRKNKQTNVEQTEKGTTHTQTDSHKKKHKTYLAFQKMNCPNADGIQRLHNYYIQIENITTIQQQFCIAEKNETLLVNCQINVRNKCTKSMHKINPPSV